jgi:proteasome lid subunit RPN8/RPN11
MKPNGKFKILNLNPILLISHYDLEAIKHIVSIAPQEAQWFHRCERIVKGSNIYYRIYEMYIPEQTTSAATVESDPQMMYRFYKELKEEHGPEKTNDIMSNLTVWCHSHHNMGVNPSGQDIKQFKEQCSNATKSNIENPQIMMIFNKKDSFYSKIWDPEYNVLYENVDIVYLDYDFSHIDKAAKDKFKKPKPPKYLGYRNPFSTKESKRSVKNSTKKSHHFLDWNWEQDYYFEETSTTSNFLENSKVISDYIKINALKSYTLNDMIAAYYTPHDTALFTEKLHKTLDLNTTFAMCILLSFDEGDISILNNDNEYLTEEDSRYFGCLQTIDDIIEAEKFDPVFLFAIISTAEKIAETEIEEGKYEYIDNFLELLDNLKILNPITQKGA